jgi:subtilisin-like proprotein convertase family protein
LAHQFSANHSWSNCPGNGGQIAFGSAYEPGSGSTIMSYSGSCGDQNIQFGSDTYYHVVNLEEIINFSRVAAGSGCPDVIPTDNNEPTIDLHYEDGFFIPISTPFELTATAEDPDGDIITYCWEQFDRGPISPIGQPTGNTPLFRSFPPNTSPTRTFPRLQALLGNFSENSEVLPTYSRAMTFRCSVRDSDPLAGGSVWETVAFQATDQAGPFLVQQPNSSATEWVGGEKVEVQWDVANTDAAPVNCQAVSILLSTDGGFTYPYTLANGIPNTGSAEVFVPNVTTNSARIKVAATYNVFFDVSNANFSISEAQEPGYGVSIAEPSIQQICVPETYDLSFVTSSFAGYSEQVSIEIIEGLPSYVDASFSANPVPAGETSVLNLDFSEVEEEEIIDLVFQITAPGQDPVELTASLDLVLTDFSNLAMLNPANGVGNLSIGNGTFVWTDIPNANSYDVQISDSPVFEESIIDEATDLSGNEFSISVALDENTLYYWRIRPKNECGYGEWLPPFAFHTENVICEKYDALDLPLGIPAVGLPTKTSTLTVVEAGTITDINVINLKGNHDAINDIEMRLQGPDETEVVLFSKICGNTAPFNMGFDDESPLEISCPPNVGQPYQPEEALAAFDGTNIQGDWKLHVEVIDDFGAGGLVETWGLEFCAGFSPQSPELIVNEPLLVKNGAFNYLSNEVLLATDPDNTAEELKYTLVSVPQFGTLKWFDNELSVGDTYLQVQVDAFHLRYFNDNGGTDSDSFTFVIEDGTGGFVGITQFDIILDPDAPVATSEPSPKPKIALFPNPNNGQATILLPFEADQEVLIQVSDMQGRILHQQQAGQGSRQIELNIPELPGGLYLVSVRMGDRMFVEKMVVE